MLYFLAGCPKNVLNVGRLHACAIPTWFTRPFLLVRGWDLGMRQGEGCGLRD